MTDKEARELLGLRKTGKLGKADVETAFAQVFREHQAKLNASLTFQERDTESKILILLAEARKICLGIQSAKAAGASQSAGSSSAASHSVPQPINSGSNQAPRGSGVRNAATRFANVFRHIGLAVKNLLGFFRAIPEAFGDAWDFICDVLEQLRRAGIPKIAVVLTLILGFLPLIKGCVQAFDKVTGMLK